MKVPVRVPLVLSLILLPLYTLFAAPPDAIVGQIEDFEGSVSIIRSGKEVDVDYGESLLSRDLVKTGNDGYLVVGLDRSVGMSGTLVIRPKTTCALSTVVENGHPATEADTFAGTVAVKVKKIAGDPRFRVRSGAAVMGVRGTEFLVTSSPNNAILVSCSEGRVECQSDYNGKPDVVDAVPGQVVEKRDGERFKRIPVAVSSVAAFHDRWGSGEVEAFKASPVQVLDQYAASYERHKAAYIKAAEALLALPAVDAWIQEDLQGVVPYERDVSVMKQKSAIVPKLMSVRSVLFFFEPAYYRLDQVREYVRPQFLSHKLSTGKTVKAFYQELARDLPGFEVLTSRYRQVLYLYALRNGGKDPFATTDSDSFDMDMDSSGSDDFFDEDDDFFN